MSNTETKSFRPIKYGLQATCSPSPSPRSDFSSAVFTVHLVSEWVRRKRQMVFQSDWSFYFRNTETYLTLSWRGSLSHRNQSIDLHSKSMDWFLYDRHLCHERVKTMSNIYELKAVNYFHKISIIDVWLGPVQVFEMFTNCFIIIPDRYCVFIYDVSWTITTEKIIPTFWLPKVFNPIPVGGGNDPLKFFVNNSKLALVKDPCRLFIA